MQSFFDKTNTWTQIHQVVLGRIVLGTVLLLLAAWPLAAYITHDYWASVLLLAVLVAAVSGAWWYRQRRKSLRQASAQETDPTLAYGLAHLVPTAPEVIADYRPTVDSKDDQGTSTKAEAQASESLRHLADEPFVMPKWPLITGVTLLLVAITVIQVFFNGVSSLMPAALETATTVARIIVTALVFFAIAYYTWMVQKQYQQDYPSPAQVAVPISTRIYEEGGKQFSLIRMSDQGILDMMKYLVINQEGHPEFSDKRILAVTRKFEGKLKRKDLVLTLCWALVVIGTARLASVVVGEYWLPITTVVALLLGLPMMIHFCVQWLKWYSWRLLRTDKRTILVIKWPAWLFWLNGSDLPIADSEVNQCRSCDQDNLVSKSYRVPYGILQIDTESERDVDAHEIRDVPYHRALERLINSMRQFGFTKS
jgi:hypothetical protein